MYDANFSSTSITGYGSSLSLLSASSQYVTTSNPQLTLYNQSWTFEAWIYLTSNMNATQYGIIGQCKAQSTDECLHLIVRHQKLYFGFYYNDLPGDITLKTAKWYHVAFVFDCDNLTQSIYLDGVIDGSRHASECFRGRNQALTFGMIEAFGPGSYFDGLIDQVSFMYRTKNSTEILRDATLVVFFPFENNTYDQGPLRINGSLCGNSTFVSGRVGQGLEVKNINQSSFEVHGLVLLGVSNRSYSFAIWIRPYVQQQSTILHLAMQADGSGWCVPVLGLTITGQLSASSNELNVVSLVGPVVPISSWTHAAVTYNGANGMRLYVNGTLSSTSASLPFNPGGQPMHLFVGSPRSGIALIAGYSNSGPYSGAVDELRVYSRELSDGDVAVLANP